VNIENKGEFDEEITVEIFYDAMKVFAVDLFLKRGGNSNLLFSPLDSYQFIWGTHSMHMVEAKVSITSGEFQQSDNTQVLLYEGKVIRNPSPFQLPFIFFALAANVALGLAGWAVLKQFMSERPSFLVYLTKMSEFLKRKLAR
jgi:hypothetical protein